MQLYHFLYNAVYIAISYQNFFTFYIILQCTVTVCEIFIYYKKTKAVIIKQNYNMRFFFYLFLQKAFPFRQKFYSINPNLLLLLANIKHSSQKNFKREINKFFLIHPITHFHYFQHLFK